MNNLKQQLIRLGNRNPNLRDHIRPLLQHNSVKTAFEKMDKGWLDAENPDFPKADRAKGAASSFIEMLDNDWEVKVHRQLRNGSLDKIEVEIVDDSSELIWLMVDYYVGKKRTVVSVEEGPKFGEEVEIRGFDPQKVTSAVEKLSP
jgi:hypothetical protein